MIAATNRRRALRVGLLCGNLEPALDGVADYARLLALHLRRIGLEPLLLTTYRLAGDEPNGSIGVTNGWSIGGVHRAARAIAELGLDVVHVQFAPSVFDFSRTVGLLPGLLRRGPPMVITLHEYGIWSAKSPLGRISGALWAAAERCGFMDREVLLFTPQRVQVVVTNSNHAGIVAARFPTAASGLVEIPIGPNIGLVTRDRAHARRSLRQRLGMRPEAPLVVFFGFLHPVKDLDRLIRAVGLLEVAHPDLRLVLMGGVESHSMPPRLAGQLRRALEGVARRHGVDDKVVFTDYIPASRVSETLLAADVAAFPFKNGVTMKSGSLLAALSHGVPVIATSRDGAASEDEGVLWIAPEDTAALASGIDRLLVDPAVGSRLRRAGAALIECYRWPSIAAAHARVYVDVMARSYDRDRMHGGVGDVDA